MLFGVYNHPSFIVVSVYRSCVHFWGSTILSYYLLIKLMIKLMIRSTKIKPHSVIYTTIEQHKTRVQWPRSLSEQDWTLTCITLSTCEYNFNTREQHHTKKACITICVDSSWPRCYSGVSWQISASSQENEFTGYKFSL